jgi:hypothetical protein
VADQHQHESGEIAQLLDLIEQHESEFMYDWRSRFGLPLDVVLDGRMSWPESYGLMTQLTSDPTSRVGAALAGLAHPVDVTSVVLADLWDLTLQLQMKKGKKAPEYPRSWLRKAKVKASAMLSQEKIREVLRARGHDV